MSAQAAGSPGQSNLHGTTLLMRAAKRMAGERWGSMSIEEKQHMMDRAATSPRGSPPPLAAPRDYPVTAQATPQQGYGPRGERLHQLTSLPGNGPTAGRTVSRTPPPPAQTPPVKGRGTPHHPAASSLLSASTPGLSLQPEEPAGAQLQSPQPEPEQQAPLAEGMPSPSAAARMPTAALGAKIRRYKSEPGHSTQVAVPSAERGWSTSHGYLTFTSAEADRRVLDANARTFDQAQQAKFLIVRDEGIRTPFNKLKTVVERQRRIEILLEIVQTMEHEWDISMPPMILSVTGNALPFDMRPKFQNIFKQALVKATQSTSAWVTTGGTDGGVMKLTGDAMKNSTTPVIGVASWGVIKGRARLTRPSLKEIQARIEEQICARNTRPQTFARSPQSGDGEHTARAHAKSQGRPLYDGVKDEYVPTHPSVLQHYAETKASGWADPETPPMEIKHRLSFLAGSSKGATVGQLGLINREGFPDIGLSFPHLRTGRRGRGMLGQWGPNQATDTIVTKKLTGDIGVRENGSSETGLQVALMFRDVDQVWALPGKFTRDSADIKLLSQAATSMKGELPSSESSNPQDRARIMVRQIFELEGIPPGHAEEFKELFDELFKKASQNLVYRGYSDDPRNTDEAWVETSAWHVHCPADLADDLDAGYSQSSSEITWMNIVVNGDRLDFTDDTGKVYTLFASHRELIEMAVFEHVQGNRDMPFEYDGIATVGDNGVGLNPNHSHYICVDNGTNGCFGVEVALRGELEAFISSYDYGARGMNKRELVEYFSKVTDESSITLNGNMALTHNVPSQPIPLFEDTTELRVVRTACDGIERRVYTIKISKLDDHALQNQASITIQKFYRGSSTRTQKKLERGLQKAARLQASACRFQSSESFNVDGSDLKTLRLSAGTLAFKPDKLTYTVSVPSDVQSVQLTAEISSGPKQRIQYTVPTVILCYGGGPQTLQALLAAGQRPIIVVRGSMRAVQFIEEFYAAQKNIDAEKKAERREQLIVKQHKQAERSLRLDLCTGPGKGLPYTHFEEMADKPGWWDVHDLVDALDKLVKHEQLHFFDINAKTTVKTSKEIRLNPMLPPLLDSIVKSMIVKSSVKLPLAVRLNYEGDVKKLCDKHGIARFKNPLQEASRDGRFLVYAAFHDQGRTLGRLLDAGFDIAQLDHLILCEIKRAIDLPDLIKRSEPPEWWINSQFQAGIDKQDQEYRDLIAARWASARFKLKTKKSEIYREIQWFMMPSVSGWTFRVVDTATCLGVANMVFQQLSCTRANNQLTGLDSDQEGLPLMRRSFVVMSPPKAAGVQLTCVDKSSLRLTGNTFDCEVEKISSEDLGPDVIGATVSLKPIIKDNITVWLPLAKGESGQNALSRFCFANGSKTGQRSWWCLPKGGKLERQMILRAFNRWLGPSCGTQPDLPLHDLHRIFWAIRSNRPKVAMELIKRSTQPIIAGLFSAYLYSQQRLPKDFVPDADLKAKYQPKAMCQSAEQYACDVLENTILSGSNAAFDEIVFYGAEEERGNEYRTYIAKEKDQLENVNLRSALTLMNIPTDTGVTHLDIALQADCKQFMNMAGPRQFLVKLWCARMLSNTRYMVQWVRRFLLGRERPSNNGNWVQSQIAVVSPAVKGSISLLFFATFLVFYISVLVSMPDRSATEIEFSTQELVFWAWVAMFAISEMHEAVTGFDSVSMYLKGSGNTIDGMIIIVFGAAISCRVIVEAGDSTRGGSQRETWLELDALIALLCLNFMLCSTRFLLMLSIAPRVGVMVIITLEIVKRDIVPFLAFAVITLACFETASFFFFWFLDVRYLPGSFFNMFTELGATIDRLEGTYLEWDRPSLHLIYMYTTLESVFFLVTVVVLLNLLIAMMADTYSKIQVNAEAEYQMKFARLVKEYYEAPVLPVPLSVVERGINWVMGEIPLDSGDLSWGKHYTWPASTLPFQLELAMRKVAVKKEQEKERKQDKSKPSK